MSDSAFADFSYTDKFLGRAFRSVASGGLLSAAEVTSNARKSTWSRLGFAAVMGALGTAALPVATILAWLAVLGGWELAVRLKLEDWIVAPAARTSQKRAFHWLAAIHCAGGLLYTAFPIAAWLTGDAIGMVLATAWICASANHVFVYFASSRLLMAACLVPLALCAVAAPFATAGLTVPAFAGAATLGALILSAALFGVDRRILLGNLAKHAAARAAAEQANAAKSQFLATMSHELRTPLNAVIGYAELINEQAERGPIADDAVKIGSSARQLLNVIDVILDLSKLETGAIELERERCDVSAVLEQLQDVTPALAATNGNTLRFVEATPLGSGEFDHRRLHQCLLQLISNAAKFTKNGAITVTVAQHVDRGRMRLCFDVADTGIGIPPEQQARIFEPFVQGEGDAARRFEGTGLGLTLVRRLARLMGGDVTLESATGQGSVFKLWIDAGTA